VTRRLADWTGDRRQFASVRRIMLDEGPERGVVALAFSTGGGLDFWVLIDRAMDIGPLWWRGLPVAWQSPAGFRHPSLVDPADEAGYGFSRGFSGFLMTAGLDHTRHPADGRPLHGRLPFLPARLLAYGEAFDAPEPHLFCEGEITQWRHGHEHLALIRRIEAPIGGARLKILDRVVNRGAAAQRHALLYHINTGHPFLCPGARIGGNSSPLPEPLSEPVPTSASASACRPAVTGGDGFAELSLERPDGAAMRVSFSAATLPFAQVWTDLRPGTYVASLEPCTDAKSQGGISEDVQTLGAGEARNYEVRIAFSESRRE
jgi:Domain of unknown function (DUF4432)